MTIRDIESGAEQVITSNRIHPFFVQLPQSRSLLHLTSTSMDVPPSSEGHDYKGEIENGYWIDAANLKSGYRLLNADGTFAEVTAVRVEATPLKAYNISVDGFETFFVRAETGSDPVWVHNCRGRKPRIENGNSKQGWQHIDERHVGGSSAKGAGDLFANGTTRNQLEKAAATVVQKGVRLSKPSRRVQLFEKRIKINGKSDRVRVLADSKDGNRVITMFPARGNQ